MHVDQEWVTRRIVMHVERRLLHRPHGRTGLKNISHTSYGQTYRSEDTGRIAIQASYELVAQSEKMFFRIGHVGRLITHFGQRLVTQAIWSAMLIRSCSYGYHGHTC